MKLLDDLKATLNLFKGIHNYKEKNYKVNFISGFSHINIGVTDMNEAIEYYSSLLGCQSKRVFENFKNIGFAKSAGFLVEPNKVEVTIAFLEIPYSGITLELMQYHSPAPNKKIRRFGVNDIGGVRHIALKVNNILEAFNHVKNHDDVQLINPSLNYHPYKIDSIKSDEFRFFDPKLEKSKFEKEKVCRIVSNIRYFYFFDKYGVQWEFEQGHHDLRN